MFFLVSEVAEDVEKFYDRHLPHLIPTHSLGLADLVHIINPTPSLCKSVSILIASIVLALCIGVIFRRLEEDRIALVDARNECKKKADYANAS